MWCSEYGSLVGQFGESVRVAREEFTATMAKAAAGRQWLVHVLANDVALPSFAGRQAWADLRFKDGAW